jgi:predicted lipoprotein with Yx(FWY)xxD motif
MTRRETTTRRAQLTPAAQAGRQDAEPPGLDWRTVVLRVAGAGLLIATGAIHLDLYLTGYRTIPTIGWLFLLQVIAAFGLGLAVLAIGPPAIGSRSGSRSGSGPGSGPGGRTVIAGRLAAAGGAGFALATLGGYLLSVWIGLFGFKEVRTTTGIVAGVIEVAAFAILAALALAPARTAATPSGFPARIPPAVARAAATGAAGLAVAARVLLAVAVAGANPPAPAATGTGTALKTTTIGGTTVLTNARGFTLYSFAPDTPTTSKCYGSCAAYWPPVTGTATASPGLPGRVGTIARTGGSRQLTYDGHPLYTYIGDSGPGQAKGNNLNLNGGLWHEVSVSR